MSDLDLICHWTRFFWLSMSMTLASPCLGRLHRCPQQMAKMSQKRQQPPMDEPKMIPSWTESEVSIGSGIVVDVVAGGDVVATSM
mmetsp:Transcript_126261/g.351815  ORF Transcript_126261/g.351815 Transcript_126261/m.351815 type:complete len:85 (+) Transcript_126261:239-493(+)